MGPEGQIFLSTHQFTKIINSFSCSPFNFYFEKKLPECAEMQVCMKMSF